MRVRHQPSRGAEAVSDRAERLRTLVDQNRIVVTRILRRRGVPQADLDDEVQRTFVAVAQRLADVQRGSERSFVHGVAINVAWRARRRLMRSREVLLSGELPEHGRDRDTPESLVERKQTRLRLDGIIEGTPPSLRAVFILSAIDGLTRPEIAALLLIPRGTVASRLRRARAYLREQLVALEMGDNPGRDRSRRKHEAVVSASDTWSPLAQALLDAGMATSLPGATRAKVLAVLGLTPAGAG